MLAKAQVEPHLLHYGLIMVSCKSYTHGRALIRLPKGKFLTDIPTLTEQNEAAGLRFGVTASNFGLM